MLDCGALTFEAVEIGLGLHSFTFVHNMKTGIPYLPPEIKGLIVQELGTLGDEEDCLSSIALVWRDAWHEIRSLRCRFIWVADASRLAEQLPLFTSYPELFTYIKEIDVGPGISKSLRHSTTCRNLSKLLTMATNAHTLDLEGFEPARLLSKGGVALRDLRAAFKASSVKNLSLDKLVLTTPADLIDFLSLLPNLTAMDIESTIVSSQWPLVDTPPRVSPFPRFYHLSSLSVSYSTSADRQFLDLVAQESIFPNIRDFRFEENIECNALPVLRKLLPLWSASLVALDLLKVWPDFGTRFALHVHLH